MFPLDSDIPGQSSEPFWSEAAPHHQSYQRRDDTDDHDKFAQLAHRFKKLRESSEGTSLIGNARTVPRLL
jgi:hypothetical protein